MLGHKSDEYYDEYNLLFSILHFLSEFGLKPNNFTLHENTNINIVSSLDKGSQDYRISVS